MFSQMHWRRVAHLLRLLLVAVGEVRQSPGDFKKTRIASSMGPRVPPAVAVDASRALLSPAGRGGRGKGGTKARRLVLQTPPPTTKQKLVF